MDEDDFCPACGELCQDEDLEYIAMYDCCKFCHEGDDDEDHGE